MIHSLLRQKKGQVWTIDFVIGLMLFLFIIAVSTKVLLDMYQSPHAQIVYRDAVYISDKLLLAGYPEDWNSTNVIMLGVGGNNRINETKILAFDTLDYYSTKTLLHVTSDFIFFIRNSTQIQNISQCVHGYDLNTDAECNPILTDVNYDDLVKIDRLIIYDSKVMILTLYVWD
jgi:hypothetical protein